MSGFDGLPENLIPDGVVCYEPGNEPFPPGLAASILDLYLNGTLRDAYMRSGSSGKASKKAQRIMDTVFSSYDVEALDANALLDHLLLLAPENVPDSLAYRNRDTEFSLDYIISPLVQTLHSAGHNDFQVNLTHIPEAERRIASYLKGKKDRPLILTYCGNGNRTLFGQEAQHCHLTALSDVNLVGIHATEFEFVLDAWVNLAGEKSRRCTFHVNTPNEEEAFSSIPCYESVPSGNRYYVKSGMGPSRVDTLKAQWFWGYEPPADMPSRWWPPWNLLKRVENEIPVEAPKELNHLFVPDDDGNWKEVTP